MSALRERVRRRWMPRLVVALSRVRRPAKAAAATRRLLRRSGRVELYVAFDDPCSAVALIALRKRLAGRPVRLVPLPVVERGIAGDPATERKRRYALADARRLGRRMGLELGRDDPLAAGDVEFLAAWIAAAPRGADVAGFSARALERIWFGEPGAPVEPGDYAALWREITGGEPPDGDERALATLRRNRRRMRRRGPWDTPAAWVHGRWFFAHDRLDQIGRELDLLGWRAGR